MEYLIEFEIDVVNKKSFVSRKNGEIEITSELSINVLKLPENENTIKYLIYEDIQPKIKQKIFNIDIISIALKKRK